VLLLYLPATYRMREEEGRLHTFVELEEAIVEGAAQRIRPKLMTVHITFIGLLPIMWSAGTGADMMRRIAEPMVGGLGNSFSPSGKGVCWSGWGRLLPQVNRMAACCLRTVRS
jgi:Cu(I)/Ag(I) efflux system membrane protein CusA/SilA